jgi:WD40 repeat protein
VVATANWDGTISLVSATTLKPVGILQRHRAPVLCVIFSKDGKRLFSSSRDGRVIAWNVETKTVEHEFSGHKMWVECLAESPDGTLLASGDWDGVIKVWDIATKKCVATIRAHDDAVLSLAFSPDGHLFVSGAQDRHPLKLWRTDTWAEKAVLRNDDMSVRCILFLSNDELACGSNDRAIQIWNTKNENCLSTWKAHEKGWVMRLALSPDKRRFVSGDLTGQIKMWNIGRDIKQPIEELRSDSPGQK